jgi:hypothetical protein
VLLSLSRGSSVRSVSGPTQPVPRCSLELLQAIALDCLRQALFGRATAVPPGRFPGAAPSSTCAHAGDQNRAATVYRQDS